MRNIYLFTLFIAFATNIAASAQGNPSSYYRKIASEQRKIRSKQINYYKTALLYNDAKRLVKSRDMILNQVKTSMRNLSRTPAFRGDSAIRNDYIRILEQYEEAYTDVFDSVQTLKQNATASKQALKQYQEAFYYMEFLLDDAEDRWLSNEEYFTNAYQARPMDDPTITELTALRDLAMYVEEMRNTYTDVVYMIKAAKQDVKLGKFDMLEDQRLEIATEADEALTNAITVGEYQWYDEDDIEHLDDYLLREVKQFLNSARDVAEISIGEELTTYDEARYDGNDKRAERSKEKIERMLDYLLENVEDLNETVTDLVANYAGE